MSDATRHFLLSAVVFAVGVTVGAAGHARLAAPVRTWTLGAGRACLVRVQGPAVLEEHAEGTRIRSAWPLEVTDAPAQVAAVGSR